MTPPNQQLLPGPLTADAVKLLTPGKSVLRSVSDVRHYRVTGDLLTAEAAAGQIVSTDVVWYRANNGNVAFGPFRYFSYIGEIQDDGWISWSGGENPVPGQMVQVRFRYGGTNEEPTFRPSEGWNWTDYGDHSLVIIAFRVPEQGEAGGVDLAALKDRLADEITVAAEQSDATPFERHVAEALTSDDAKQKGLVDRVWVVSLPDARKAIAAVASWNAVNPTNQGEVVADLLAALRPFAEVLADVGQDEDDSDIYRAMTFQHRRAPAINVGHLRKARAAISKAEASR